MAFPLIVEGLRLPVSQPLVQHVCERVKALSLPASATSLTLNYRDSGYSPERGGYHPVEIQLIKQGDQWHFSYITDFAFAGSPAELEKEIDFDFGQQVFSHAMTGPLSITDAIDLYQLWETNFISYLKMEVYDDLDVTHEA